jgi:hypothetical protein
MLSSIRLFSTKYAHRKAIFVGLILCCVSSKMVFAAHSKNTPPQYLSAKKVKTSTNCLEKTDSLPIFTIVDEQPEFVGGANEMWKWIGANLKYPKEASEYGDEGKIYVGFVVEIDGSISNVSIKRASYLDRRVCCHSDSTIDVKSHTKALEVESMRLIASMPTWIPGKHKGVPVRVEYCIPLKFWLE